MIYFKEYEERIGDMVVYLALSLGLIGFLVGVLILLLNRKYLKPVEFVSAVTFFGYTSFSIGSFVYFYYVENDANSKKLFLFVLGTSTILGLGTGFMILLPILNFLGSFMIGLCGGFSMLNFIIGSTRSDYVLLFCSILFGLIGGYMSHFYQYPFHIVILPFTGAYLLQLSSSAILNSLLSLSSVSALTADNVAYYCHYVFLALFYLALCGSLYYHYITYYLKRENRDMLENHEEYLNTKRDNHYDPIRLPSRAQKWKNSMF